MDKNLPKDPLEEFFKKSLEGQQELPSDDGWDVPSSNVWDRIEVDIQPTAVIRPINYWKWATAAAAVVLLSFVYQLTTQNQEIEKLATEVKQHEEQIEQIKEELITTQHELESTVAAQNTNTINYRQSSKNEEVAQRDESKDSQRAPSFSRDYEEGIGGQNNNDIPNVPSQNTEMISIPNANQLILDQKENTIVDNQSSLDLEKTNSDHSKVELIQKEKVADVNSLPNRYFLAESLKEVEIVKPTFNEWGIIKKTSFDRPSNFYLGVYGSRNIGKRNTVGDKSSLSQARIDQINKVRVNSSWTTGGGVKIGYRLNDRWSIESGLQYTKSEVNARHRIPKQYDASNEIQDLSTGNYENEVALSLVTSIGDIDSDVTLSRDAGVPIVNQTFFNIPIESNQKVSFLGIPLVAKYSFGHQKVRLGLKGGLLTNFVLDADVKISEIDSPLPILEHRRHRIKSKSDLKNLKSTTIDILGGIEAEIKINDKMYFSFEPSISKSLTPIFEKNDVETYPVMANVRMGVNYLF